MSRCLVRGSINVDEFFHVQDVVRPGETISSTSLDQRAGGKGANQAVALAKAGTPVILVGAIGHDGLWALDQMREAGVDVSQVQVVEQPTGRAVIQLTASGENSIILFKGANYHPHLTPPSLPQGTTHLLLQNEIPFDSTLGYLHLAYEAGATSVFNPSPMPSPEQLRAFPWEQLEWLIVNEGEAATLLVAFGSEGQRSDIGLDTQQAQENPALPPPARTAHTTLARLHQHPRFSASVNLICTLGPLGVLALPAASSQYIYMPAAKLQEGVKDTTGAGDCFAGYFVAGLIGLSGKGGESEDLEAIKAVLARCVQAAGLCVERRGAMESIPTMEEVQARLG